MSIITISRGTFSGGMALGKCLAERLGYACLNREDIADSATKEYDLSPEKLAVAMDRPPSFWQQLIPQRTGYLNYFRAALCDRAVGGSLVYVGFVGHLHLAGVSHVLRVRVIDDIESRISDAMRRLQVARPEAIAYIEKADVERAWWTKFLFGVRLDDPSLYDVVLNLEHLGLDGACEIVAGMTELEQFKPTVESQKAMADLALGSRVLAALTKDSRTASARVSVVARGAAVTVVGGAGSEREMNDIPLVAGSVSGVAAVNCEVGIGTDWYW